MPFIHVDPPSQWDASQFLGWVKGLTDVASPLIAWFETHGMTGPRLCAPITFDERRELIGQNLLTPFMDVLVKFHTHRACSMFNAARQVAAAASEAISSSRPDSPSEVEHGDFIVSLSGNDRAEPIARISPTARIAPFPLELLPAGVKEMLNVLGMMTDMALVAESIALNREAEGPPPILAHAPPQAETALQSTLLTPPATAWSELVPSADVVELRGLRAPTSVISVHKRRKPLGTTPLRQLMQEASSDDMQLEFGAEVASHPIGQDEDEDEGMVLAPFGKMKGDTMYDQQSSTDATDDSDADTSRPTPPVRKVGQMTVEERVKQQLEEEQAELENVSDLDKSEGEEVDDEADIYAAFFRDRFDEVDGTDEMAEDEEEEEEEEEEEDDDEDDEESDAGTDRDDSDAGARSRRPSSSASRESSPKAPASPAPPHTPAPAGDDDDLGDLDDDDDVKDAVLSSPRKRISNRRVVVSGENASNSATSGDESDRSAKRLRLTISAGHQGRRGSGSGSDRSRRSAPKSSDDEEEIEEEQGNPDDSDSEDLNEALFTDAMTEVLKEHQRLGIDFAWKNLAQTEWHDTKTGRNDARRGCILAHAMGAGKTLQAIILAHLFVKRDLGMRILIVVPSNLETNWANEIRMWKKKLHLTRRLLLFRISGAGKQRDRTFAEWDRRGGVLLLSSKRFNMMYRPEVKVAAAAVPADTDALQMDEDGTTAAPAFADANVASSSVPVAANGAAPVPPPRKFPQPELLIVDEAHLLKNPKSQGYRAVDAMKDIPVLLMTGSPLQNHLEEYHSMARLIVPSLLPSLQTFKRNFVAPISKALADMDDPDAMRFAKRQLGVLRRKMDQVLHRVTRQEVMGNDFDSYVVLCRQSPLQAEVTRTIKSDLQTHRVVLLDAVKRNGYVSVHPEVGWRYLCAPRPKLILRAHDGAAAGDDESSQDGSAPMPPPMTPLQLRRQQAMLKREEARLKKQQAAQARLEQLRLQKEQQRRQAQGQLERHIVEEINKHHGRLQQFLRLRDLCLERATQVSPDNEETPRLKEMYEKTSHEVQLSEAMLAQLQDQLQNLPQLMADAEREEYENGDDNWDDPGVMISEDPSLLPGVSSSGADESKSTPMLKEAKAAMEDFDSLSQSPKLETLLRLVQLISVERNEKVLIFVDHRESLNLVEQAIRSELHLDCLKLHGEISKKKRDRSIRRFMTKDKYKVFLLTKQSGGVGLNLTAATRVIICEASWNPVNDEQAICRAHRLGQQRRVFAYHLLGFNALESSVFKRGVHKTLLRRAVVDNQPLDRPSDSVMIRTMLAEDPEPLGGLPAPEFTDEVLNDLIRQLPSTLVDIKRPSEFSQRDQLEDVAMAPEDDTETRTFVRRQRAAPTIQRKRPPKQPKTTFKAPTPPLKLNLPASRSPVVSSLASPSGPLKLSVTLSPSTRGSTPPPIVIAPAIAPAGSAASASPPPSSPSIVMRLGTPPSRGSSPPANNSPPGARTVPPVIIARVTPPPQPVIPKVTLGLIKGKYL